MIKMFAIIFTLILFASNLEAAGALAKSQIVGHDELHKVDIVLDSDGKRKMLVKSDTSISTSLGISQQYDLNVVLNNTTYYTAYSVVGIKTLSGFVLEFDNEDVTVRLEVDGIVIFELYCKKIKDLLDWDKASLPPMYISWNSGLKAFYFTPSFPMKSSTSIKILLKGNGKKYKANIIQVSN